MSQTAGLRPVRLGDFSVDVETKDGGVHYIRSRAPLPEHAPSLIHRLDDWATRTPDTIFIADRGEDGNWREVTYAQARERTLSLAQALLDAGLSAERPLVILSGNSIEHALLGLAAQRAGVAYAPISPAYSLVSSDHAKIKHIFDLLTPGMVFVQDAAPFEKALASVAHHGAKVVAAKNHPAAALDYATLEKTVPTPAVDAALAAIGPDTIAKFLFTSGSTGMPKAVINTHRMFACNQAMIAEALAFLKDEPPVLVDWLPWNHTAGGNHNFGLVVHNGGTIYIDDGAPTPGGIARTIRNLEEISPNLYFNVPKGYEMLAEHLSRNDRLRESFFARLKLIQYAGAGLAQHVWDALENLSVKTLGSRVMIITGYGSTETAPYAFTTTWVVNRPGEIGMPAPGMEVKLVPDGEKLELRLRGPNITPGYWRQPDKTAESFDEEGFYCIGDAIKFVDPQDASKGFLFDGRVSEDFKLSTGTWVNMAGVRGAIVKSFAPYVRDAVLTGLNRNHIGALLFLDPDAARKFAPELADADEAKLAAHEGLRAEFQKRLDALAAESTGSSTRVARAIILDRPPSIDASELTDKGSINQRAVMSARAQLVEDIYAEPAPAHVLVARRG